MHLTTVTPKILGAICCLAALAGPLWVFSKPRVGALGVPVGRMEAQWGEAGQRPGAFVKPRAIAVSPEDELYLVDKTARIQVFGTDGEYRRGWSTPASQYGKPTGLSFSQDGLLMVADTHYYRILFYRPDGTLVPERTLGGDTGPTAGRLGWVTDVVQDSQGNYYVSEYGEWDRIQKFTPAGKWQLEWGQHGTAPGEFSRPQSLVMDRQDRLYVADSCNHRIQVFDCRQEPPQLLACWGKEGSGAGEFRYPYSLLLDQEGHLVVVEFGNHRVQKCTIDGECLAVWGTMGRGPGELYNPWAVAQNSRGRLWVVDTYNNRVYQISL